jgi:dienelactone hydrolase
MNRPDLVSFVSFVLWGLLCLPTAICANAENLSVLPDNLDGGPARQMVARHLKRLAYEALERRQKAYEALTTPEQIANYQRQMRSTFVEHLGGFPERTPLNQRTVGTLVGDGFTIEKVIYESQPRHYVTALLYLPSATSATAAIVAKPPFPAVLVPSGHSANGKAADYNQQVAMLLARHGIAALCYDPIGQGERSQMLGSAGQPRYRSTTEHTLVGAGSIPVGRGTATFRIWDGIRSIDYLADRGDIDMTKIGVTGCSGGGTLTSYLMALDDRVACAAPSCYLTSFRRLIDTIGPQDAEQNIHGQLAFGMDHADYLMLRAPKPTLILASTEDFFDITGTWDTFRQAKRLYTRLGFAERVELVETDAKHGYPRPQREAMLRWMRRWLLGIDEAASQPAATELELKTRPDAELFCTPRGQVMLMEGARSVAELNVELNRQLESKRRELWRGGGDNARDRALAEVRRLAGIRPLAELPEPRQRTIGSLTRQGYQIEKLMLEPEPGVLLPGLLFRPTKPSGRRVLYLNGDGKEADAAVEGPIEKLAQAGDLVLAVDLRGTGETGPESRGGQPSNIWGGDWDSIFLSYLLGRSLVGMRAEDTLVSARFLADVEVSDERSEQSSAQRTAEKTKIDLFAIGAATVPALHAAAVESSLFGEVKLKGGLRSWGDVVENPAASGQLVNTVHGALAAYDLTDLVESLRGRVGVSVEKPLELTPAKER